MMSSAKQNGRIGNILCVAWSIADLATVHCISNLFLEHTVYAQRRINHMVKSRLILRTLKMLFRVFNKHIKSVFDSNQSLGSPKHIYIYIYNCNSNTNSVNNYWAMHLMN